MKTDKNEQETCSKTRYTYISYQLILALRKAAIFRILVLLIDTYSYFSGIKF
jgi:hypothetical protein